MQTARFSVEDITCYDGDWSHKQRQSSNKGVKLSNVLQTIFLRLLKLAIKNWAAED